MSLLKPLLLIIALGLVSANHTTDVATSSNSADDKKLVQALISGDATLATLGILKSQLILILKYTETHYVYILPSSHFDSKKTKFYLKGAIKMQTKWPNITKQLAEKYASTDIFLIEDEKHAFFVTFPVGPFSQIAFYRIDNGEFIEIVNDNGTDANQLMNRSFAVLPVDKPYTFYIVPKSKLLWTSLQKVRLMPNASSRLGGLSSVKHSQLIGDQIYLCYTSGGYIQSNASGSTENCPPWTQMYGRIEAGFVWNSRMVIIFRNHTSKKLVVLAFDQLSSGRDRKKATRCSMEEAFIAGKSGDSEDDDGRGAGHLSKGLILGLILLGIILCLAAGLGFWLWHRRRKQVSHKASKKKSSAHRRRSSSHLKKGGRRKSQQMLKRSKSRLAKKGTSKVGRKRSTKRRVSKRRTSKMTTRGPSGSRVKYSRI